MMSFMGARSTRALVQALDSIIIQEGEMSYTECSTSFAPHLKIIENSADPVVAHAEKKVVLWH